MKCDNNILPSLSVPLVLRHAHQHQRDPEGEEPEAVPPQPALSGPESDASTQPQPLPVCASQPGAQTRGRGSESERQHLLQPPAAAHRSVCWRTDVFLKLLMMRCFSHERGDVSLHHVMCGL